MKVTLIYLPHPYLRRPEAQAPLGLMYLGAVLERNKIDVEIKNYSAYLTHQAIEDLPEADLYGITVTSLELPQANRFAYLIKEKYSKARVILGGPGTYTDEFVDWAVIDSICKGDAEATILNIIHNINSLEKVYIGKVIENLDDIPLPARHMLGTSQGGNIFADGNCDSRSTQIITSRGCPFKCAFCSAPYFSKTGIGNVRYRSTENIITEIKAVIDEYGIRQFRIPDDMFTANRKRTLELCRELSRLDITFRALARVKPFDRDLAKALVDAGCRELSIGVESFDDEVLTILNKNITAAESAETLRLCDDVGLGVKLLLMIRTPGQTNRTVPTNIEWLKQVPYKVVSCSLFVPLPGSDIWFHPDRYRIKILDHNLDHYNMYFFGRDGDNELMDIIELEGRSLDEVRDETIEMREFLRDTSRMNLG